MKKLIFTSFIALLTSIVVSQNSTATYSVNFTSNWSQATHPHSSGSLPSNAHWSKLVGATHNDQIQFWEAGQLASEAIENIAESGNNINFFTEVNAAINNGTASNLIDGPSLSTAEGEINISSIVTTNEHPLLTLITMIAPSPDWIAAVDSVSLLDANGDWLPSIVLTVAPYDTGTDSGVDYTSPNNDTNPPSPISDASGVMPFSSEPIGTFTITLEDVVLGVDEIENEKTVTLFPNPATNELNISSTQSIKTVRIYNMLGKKVLAKAQFQSGGSLDISSLASGAYLVQVLDSEGNRTVHKLLKR